MVMSFNEFNKDWQKTNNNEGYYAWVEIKGDYFVYNIPVYSFAGSGKYLEVWFDVPEDSIQYLSKDYGKTWRVWTDKPSRVLREATPWKE